jgi:hypothetical protein
MKKRKTIFFIIFAGILFISTLSPSIKVLANTETSLSPSIESRLIIFTPGISNPSTPSKAQYITISHEEIVELTKAAGLYGSTWGAINAVAAKFKKSPTWLNIMLAVVPSVGIAYLNYQDKNNRGVKITFVGPYLTPILSPL